MTINQIRYELNQMSDNEINNWLFKNYGQDGIEAYKDMTRTERIKAIAEDNAQ